MEKRHSPTTIITSNLDSHPRWSWSEEVHLKIQPSHLIRNAVSFKLTRVDSFWTIWLIVSIQETGMASARLVRVMLLSLEQESIIMVQLARYMMWRKISGTNSQDLTKVATTTQVAHSMNRKSSFSAVSKPPQSSILTQSSLSTLKMDHKLGKASISSKRNKHGQYFQVDKALDLVNTTQTDWWCWVDTPRVYLMMRVSWSMLKRKQFRRRAAPYQLRLSHSQCQRCVMSITRSRTQSTGPNSKWWNTKTKNGHKLRV